MRVITAFLLVASLLAAARAPASAVAPLADPLTGPVERVATLEFLQTEIAIALGVEPVAVTDPAGYRRWVGVGSAALGQARDLGTRQEPSLEALIAARPDAIIGSWWRNHAIADSLRATAPTILYDGLPAPDEANQYERMRAIVRDMGQRLGRPERAARALDRLDARLAVVAKRLAAAGLAGTPVILAQSVPGTTRFRLFTDNSIAVQVAEAIGLRNAWRGDSGAYGFSTVGLKALAGLADGAYLLWVTDTGAPVTEMLTGSRLWQALPVVQGDRVRVLPPDLWFFGGPLSAARLAECFAAALSNGQVAQ